MQLRMSPGGRTRYSRRRRPELPPSSVTVTTAARSAIGRFELSFSPRDMLLQPAKHGGKTGAAAERDNADRSGAILRRIIFHERTRNLAGRTVSLGIEQLGKARIFLQECEIFVVAGVIAVFRTQLNGDLQILHRRVRFAGQAIERRHRVDDVVGLRRRLAGAIEVLARFVPAAQIHQRDALGVVILGGFQGGDRRTRNPLFADAQVHQRAIAAVPCSGPRATRSKRLLGAVKFLLLKIAQGLFIGLQLLLLGRGVGVLRDGFGLPRGL